MTIHMYDPRHLTAEPRSNTIRCEGDLQLSAIATDADTAAAPTAQFDATRSDDATAPAVWARRGVPVFANTDSAPQCGTDSAQETSPAGVGEGNPHESTGAPGTSLARGQRTAASPSRTTLRTMHLPAVIPAGKPVLRILLVVISALCLYSAAEAKATDIEYLMVPSPAMGRDVPVAFRAGGPHAVVLLDAFNAAPDVSAWVTAGDAMGSFAGKGVSVVAPAGGAWSLYTNWEQDGSKQWETFLSTELPNWLAANKGLAPNGHGIVGAAQGGTGAVTMATFHPDRYRYAGSLSGFLTPSVTTMNGAITAGMARFGGVDVNKMWGFPQLGRWKWHDPDVHARLLINNNIRLWVFSPQTLTCSDPAAMIDYCDQAQGSNLAFYSHYRSLGGRNGHFHFPVDGQHDWDSWKAQLVAMSDDLARTIA